MNEIEVLNQTNAIQLSTIEQSQIADLQELPEGKSEKIEIPNCEFVEIIRDNAVEVRLELNKGIQLTRFTIIKEEVVPDPEWIYRWDVFTITAKYLIRFPNRTEWRYDFLIQRDSIIYKRSDCSEEELKSFLVEKCSQISGVRPYLNAVLPKYIGASSLDKTELFSDVLGFTIKGWKLPPKYLFRSPEDSIAKIHKNMKDLMEREYHYGYPKTTRKYISKTDTEVIRLFEKDGYTQQGENDFNELIYEKPIKYEGDPEIKELKWDYHSATQKTEVWDSKTDTYTIWEITETLSVPKAEEVKRYFKELYNNTGIQYKDLIFAFGLYQPFGHALKAHTNLQPILTMEGLPGVGKSEATDMITLGFWGNHTLLAISELASQSRAKGFLASSTFSIGIDDAEDMKEFLKGILKTLTTKTVNFVVKGGGKTKQEYVVDRPYCSMLIPNFNTRADMFKEDDALGTRNINLKITQLEEKFNWGKVYKSKPSGYIGRYIIEQTKRWNLENLVDIYENASNTFIKGRSRKIEKF